MCCYRVKIGCVPKKVHLMQTIHKVAKSAKVEQGEPGVKYFYFNALFSTVNLARSYCETKIGPVWQFNDIYFQSSVSRMIVYCTCGATEPRCHNIMMNRKTIYFVHAIDCSC